MQSVEINSVNTDPDIRRVFNKVRSPPLEDAEMRSTKPLIQWAPKMCVMDECEDQLPKVAWNTGFKLKNLDSPAYAKFLLFSPSPVGTFQPAFLWGAVKDTGWDADSGTRLLCFSPKWDHLPAVTLDKLLTSLETQFFSFEKMAKMVCISKVPVSLQEQWHVKCLQWSLACSKLYKWELFLCFLASAERRLFLSFHVTPSSSWQLPGPFLLVKRVYLESSEFSSAAVFKQSQRYLLNMWEQMHVSSMSGLTSKVSSNSDSWILYFYGFGCVC